MKVKFTQHKAMRHPKRHHQVKLSCERKVDIVVVLGLLKPFLMSQVCVVAAWLGAS